MNYAIIAAGEGSRLQAEGVKASKPMVTVGGEALIDRLLRIFRRMKAEHIDVIVNPQMPEVVNHLRAAETASDDLSVYVQSTPSSMHSLAVLADHLPPSPFCLTTVDTIFREDDFAAYIAAFDSMEVDALMAVTAYVDDEKPLYVATDARLNITAFNDAHHGESYVSAGIYLLRPEVLTTLRRCIAEGQSRMRNFQRALLADGWRVKAYPMSKVLDIDHATDIAKAEAFLAAT